MINFSGISESNLLGKALRLPLRLIPGSARVPILQGPLRGHRWIVGAGNHGYWLGTFELEKQLEFAAALRPGFIVFDIGAHVGFYTLLASILVEDEGGVFSFEPFPRNLGYLREHVKINRRDNVRIFDAAVGGAGGRALFKQGQDSSRSTGYVCAHGDLHVQVVALDEMFMQGQLPAPNVIKMDIEGGEVEALEGAKQILRSARPVIFLATHGAEIKQKCCEILQKEGYATNALRDSLGNGDEIVASPTENYAAHE